MLTFRLLSALGDGGTYRDHVTLPTAPPAVLAAGERLRGLGPAGRHRLDLAATVAEALGITAGGTPRPGELARLLEGRRGSDGAPWPGRRRAVSGIDLTWSAPKSLSLAALTSPDPAEREALLLCHQSAAEDAAREVARLIGVARRGNGGARGAEPAEAAWTHVVQLTARPTDNGWGDLHPGDPQIHSHVLLYNLVVTRDGHVGSLHTRALGGHVHRCGALYQERLAVTLRHLGVPLGPRHPCTGGVTLADVPAELSAAFSRRTAGAVEDARRYARAGGRTLEELTHRDRARLVKGGARRTRRGVGDDLADPVGWEARVRVMGWQPGRIAWRTRPPALWEGPEADEEDRPVEARVGLWSALCARLARAVACRVQAAPSTTAPARAAPTLAERTERAIAFAERRGDAALQTWWLRQREALRSPGPPLLSPPPEGIAAEADAREVSAGLGTRECVRRLILEMEATADAVAETSIALARAMPEVADRVVQGARRSGRPMEQEALRLGTAFQLGRARSPQGAALADALARQLRRLEAQSRALNEAALAAGGLTQSERAFLAVVRANTWNTVHWLPPDGDGAAMPGAMVRESLNPALHPASPAMDLPAQPRRTPPAASAERHLRALELAAREQQARIDAGRARRDGAVRTGMER